MANRSDEYWAAKEALEDAERDVERHGGPGNAGRGYNNALEAARKEARRQGVI